jgi:hypothetical protein
MAVRSASLIGRTLLPETFFISITDTHLLEAE